MRMLLTARMATETANQAVNDGTMGKMIEGIIEHLKPEAAYFTPTEGDRTCFLAFDLQDTTQIPSVAEPFFLAGAKVTLTPAMNLDDLRSGLAGLGR
jgi:hypothetical protein